MDPDEVRDFERKLDEWVDQGYQIMADDVDGELVVTSLYVSSAGAVGDERDQERWPMTPELVRLLGSRGIAISRALSGQ